MLPPKHLHDSFFQGQHSKLEWQLKTDLLVWTSQVHHKSLSYQFILQHEILQLINPFSRCHSAGTLTAYCQTSGRVSSGWLLPYSFYPQDAQFFRPLMHIIPMCSLTFQFLTTVGAALLCCCQISCPCWVSARKDRPQHLQVTCFFTRNKYL